ncbi:hypothetical protein [Streptomyces rubiginosohelvolus]|uniref:hypothetical protein n=1 Tax=Streptomyces rubiginosohelvolus TaxID=67362 RepID=UPI0035E1415B
MPGTTTPLRDRRSRKPSGLPNPPMILLAGVEKSGKRYEAALGSGSDLIGTTFWIQVGGNSATADYYGQVPGARYEIVPHDGTFRDILDAIRWALSQPAVDGKRNMIVVDDVTSVWELLSDEVAHVGRKRAERRAQSNGSRTPRLDDPYVDEERDLWGLAKDRWGEMLWLLRRHSGPTLLIARQEIITAFEGDKPTQHTTRRIKAEKNLKAAVDTVVEFHSVGEAYITGMSVVPAHWEIRPGWTYRFEGVDHLLRKLGYADAAERRSATESRPEAYIDEPFPGTHTTPPPAAHQPQQPRRPELTSEEAVRLVTAAFKHPKDPRAALLAIRAKWGTRTLRRVPTNTRGLGEVDADTLITESLKRIEALAAEKSSGEHREKGQEIGSGTASDEEPPNTEPSGTEQPEEQHRPPAEQPPSRVDDQPAPPDENSAPPPPDPQADEAPPGESPEETSAAEEPQAPRTRPRTSRTQKAMQIAHQALMDEANVQARVKFVTVGEHLGPISADGDPGIGALRDYIQSCRVEVIALLEEAGETQLAALYRSAPMPDTGIAGKFAAYFNNAPAK